MEGLNDNTLDLSPGHLEHLEEMSSHEVGEMEEFFGIFGEAEADKVVEAAVKNQKRRTEG